MSYKDLLELWESRLPNLKKAVEKEMSWHISERDNYPLGELDTLKTCIDELKEVMTHNGRQK